MPKRFMAFTNSELRRAKHASRSKLRWEAIAFLVAFAAFTLSLFALINRFYKEQTVIVPSTGGTYIEGSVGELQSLNPWFIVTNDVNRDIVSLVFSGLLKYNPATNEIEDDLATFKVSSDNRIYTLTLKEGIEWHDSTKENPHFVTPEDVLFTFKTIQDPEFPNAFLRQNYLGVDIEKLDDRTIRFKLEEPYSFFASNLTLGLMPERSFEGVPISKLDQTLDFGFQPVGAGPYMYKSFISTELSSEITLERFFRPIDSAYHLKQVIFRIFPDFITLLSDIRNLDGVRLVPRNEQGDPIVPRQFRAINYSLPQYVALFLNLDRPILHDQKLRLGLQLGTNKQVIVDELNESLIVDTPLLEIDVTDWRYQFNPETAQGAFFSSNWNLPEKVRLQRLLEMNDANIVGALHIEPIVLLDTGAVLSITGSLVDIGSGAMVNGIPVIEHPTATGTWIVSLPTHGGTGSILLGQNLLRITNRAGDIVDSAYVWRSTSTEEYKRASQEQNLLELFIKTRDGEVPEDERITVFGLFLDKGLLRKRASTDPHDIRINNNGDRLSLTLLTSPSPPQYRKIAELIQEQWASLGVHVGIAIPESRKEFEERVLYRDYDIILFGQSLLDNLDSYPYWHSAGSQKLTGDRTDLRLDAYNLSQYSSLEADTLLEIIRQTNDEQERTESLIELREVLKEDVPAIFLYSPLYTFAFNKNLKGIDLGDISLHSDRFLTLSNWYLKEERVFQAGKSWWSFPGWLLSFI